MACNPYPLGLPISLNSQEKKTNYSYLKLESCPGHLVALECMDQIALVRDRCWNYSLTHPSGCLLTLWLENSLRLKNHP